MLGAAVRTIISFFSFLRVNKKTVSEIFPMNFRIFSLRIRFYPENIPFMMFKKLCNILILNKIHYYCLKQWNDKEKTLSDNLFIIKKNVSLHPQKENNRKDIER